jgi:cytochrome c biogenesis protein CcmG, thiol:disulfide interchange protein DsbE
LYVKLHVDQVLLLPRSLAVLRHGFFIAILLHALTSSAQDTQDSQGRWIASNQAAPALVLPSIDGAEIDLASYKGRMVIVNFWATWCGPCVAEMPSLQALGRKLGDKSAVVLGVNYHESPQKVRDFQARHNIRFTLLRDPWNQASSDWSVRTLPTTFIIDAAGKLRYTVVGEVDWTSAYVAKQLATINTLASPYKAPSTPP